MASIHDVAKRAGVSPSTVSRTFTAPALISPETQRRVHQAAKELNYSPRRAPVAQVARNTGRRSTIGFQFFASNPSDMLASNTFYAPVLAGVQAEASAAGAHVLVHSTDRHTFSQELPHLVEDRLLAGLLLVGTADPEVLTACAERVPHLVLVDNPDFTDAHDCILSDGFHGAYQATRHLLDLGHRRIAFYGPETGIATFLDRQRGYTCAITEAGLPLDPSLVYVYPARPYSENDAFLMQALSGAQAPTAVLAVNDFHALQTLQVCHRLGIRVPADLSVVGFDDTRESVTSTPPLTTVAVDKLALGRLAVRRLLGRIEEARLDIAPLPACRYILPVRLIPRESSGPVKEGSPSIVGV